MAVQEHQTRTRSSEESSQVLQNLLQRRLVGEQQRHETHLQRDARNMYIEVSQAVQQALREQKEHAMRDIDQV